VFQEPSLDDRLTVYENLDFHGLVYQVPWRLRRQRINEMLALVELSDWREELVRTLSAGMKRRLEIARALIHDARVLLLDEPTVGLDVQSRARIWDYLGELRRVRDITVIVTTHYIEEVESCDGVCIIDQGKIIAKGSPAALKSEHGRQGLRIVPLDKAAEADIQEHYPNAVRNAAGQILIQTTGADSSERFLSTFGTRIKSFDLDSPSLESVFLSLTGRDIRDRAAGAREQTYASGRPGGQPVR